MLITRREGPVAVISIDRHENRNSLTKEVCEAIRAEFEALQAGTDSDDPARAVVITGEGSAFSAGADLGGGVYDEEFPVALAAMLRLMESCDVPIVAAVNGPAVGAGVQIALAADVRVVSRDAVFAIPVVKVGLAVDTWTIRKLTNIIGGGHARTVLMLARPVLAEQAATLGLANDIGDLDHAMDVARELASFAPLSLQHVKHVINDDDAAVGPAETHTDRQRKAWHSEDAVEARRARSEKRPPLFRGK